MVWTCTIKDKNAHIRLIIKINFVGSGRKMGILQVIGFKVCQNICQKKKKNSEALNNKL
ncbi:hypothetical protein KFK09_028961 [Dendrobium nobile]|uniref:Uncharacterized protein n=1 Tax=Dendrobium nobile TaxID=94219 RepID=A0A8T3A4V7_DENNO|nr:hypothetical protein KFK09_028961 [Dendrobium nobile]